MGGFHRRSSGGEGVFEQFRFWIVLEFSLAALLFAVLPFALVFLGLSDARVWSVSGIAMVVFLAAHIAYLRPRREQFARSLTPAITRGATAIYALITGAQLANVLGIGFEREFGPYRFGLFWLLVSAAVNFVRLVWVGVAKAD